MQDFKTLNVWKKSHELTLKVYKLTSKFPADELYALVSQMRRSSSSIPTNIAEGCGRRTVDDFAHFLQISLGSASELEYQVILSADLEYISREDEKSLNSMIVDVKRMLNAFITKLKKEEQK